MAKPNQENEHSATSDQASPAQSGKKEKSKPTPAAGKARPATEVRKLEEQIRALEAQNLELEERLRNQQELLQNARKFRAELDESQRLLDSITETVPSLIYISDLKRDAVVWSNQQFSAQIGENGAMDRNQLIHPDDAKLATAAIERLRDLSEGQDLVSESQVRLRMADGNWRWFLCRDRVFTRDATGKIQQIIGTATDITQRKEADSQLEKSRSLYRAIARHIPRGFVVVFNTDMEFVLAEGPFLQKLGYRKEDIEGRSVHDPLPDGKTWKYLEEPFRKALLGFDHSFEATEGDHHFLIQILPVRNEAGEIYAGMQVVLDVSELKQAQALLEERVGDLAEANAQLKKYIDSNLELEQFAYIASHDLKEPIRTVISFSQLLELKFRDLIDPEAKDYIHYIVEGTRRMQSLIDGLLSYSRVESEGRHFEPCDVNDLISAVLGGLSKVIDDREAEVFFDKLPIIQGDPTQIGQVFQNLVANAIKFNEGQPEIRIDAKARGHNWVLSVSDNGIGIPEENRDRIFNIFRRLHTRDLYDGAGIGLAVCKKIVERHGGRIWVEDSDMGGTRFCFTIPQGLIAE